MVELRPVGFFRESRHGMASGASLEECTSDAPLEHEDVVVRYLQAGAVLAASLGVAEDVLDPSAGIIGTPDILTDGVWAWPGDLAYYVKRYHVGLPAEFVDHMRDKAWVASAEGDLDISCLRLEGA